MPHGLAETVTGCYLPSKAFTPSLEVAGNPFWETGARVRAMSYVIFSRRSDTSIMRAHPRITCHTDILRVILCFNAICCFPCASFIPFPLSQVSFIALSYNVLFMPAVTVVFVALYFTLLSSHSC